jgi:hypothetical protein
MKKYFLLIFVIPIFFFGQVNSNAQSEKEMILQKCESLFGTSADEKLNLFEFNQLFVIQPAFDDENLVELQINPKYFFEEDHSDWIEPDELPQIPQNQFREIINKIENLKSKGDLLKKIYSMAITNSTLWRYEIYKNSLITYGVYEDWRETNQADLGIRWIRINFLQQVRGKVLRKENSKFYNAYTAIVETENKADYKMYIVDEKTYKSLKKNQVNIFQGIFAQKTLLSKIKPF